MHLMPPSLPRLAVFFLMTPISLICVFDTSVLPYSLSYWDTRDKVNEVDAAGTGLITSANSSGSIENDWESPLESTDHVGHLLQFN